MSGSGITLTSAIAAVKDACERAGVDGYDGEAVFFLDALLCLADGRAETADAAVSASYGVEVPPSEVALEPAVDAMAEIWQNTGDAPELYVAMQWSEVASIAAVLHAGGRPDVAGSVIVWWMAENSEDAEERADEVEALLHRYEAAWDAIEGDR